MHAAYLSDTVLFNYSMQSSIGHTVVEQHVHSNENLKHLVKKWFFSKGEMFLAWCSRVAKKMGNVYPVRTSTLD